MNSFEDLPPEQLQAVMGWFKTIKLFDGKKINQIAYDDKIFSVQETIEMIETTHQDWKRLLSDPGKDYADLRAKYYLNKVERE